MNLSKFIKGIGKLFLVLSIIGAVYCVTQMSTITTISPKYEIIEEYTFIGIIYGALLILGGVFVCAVSSLLADLRTSLEGINASLYEADKRDEKFYSAVKRQLEDLASNEKTNS